MLWRNARIGGAGPRPDRRAGGTISAGRKQGQGNQVAPGAGLWRKWRMRVIAASNDLIRLTFLQALLRDAGIACLLLDMHTSAVEGSIGAIPRRLVVAEEDENQARRVLREAGEA